MDILLLKLGDTIHGEATLAGYAGQIEALSFSHGIAQEILYGLMGRTGTIGPKHRDFSVAKYLDRASTGILDACDHGTVVPEATLTAGRIEDDKLTPYWVVTMRNVIVTSVSLGGSAGDRPTENLTLNYTAITWVYTLQQASGAPATTSASWDFAAGTERA